MKTPKKFIILLFGCGRYVYVFLTRTWLLNNQEPATEKPLIYDNPEISLYTEYPKTLQPKQFNNQLVSFESLDSAGMAPLSIRVSPTSFTWTKDWLDDQQKGDEQKSGIVILGQISNDIYFIGRIDFYERDEQGVSIFTQSDGAVKIVDGNLYEFFYPNQHKVSDPLVIPDSSVLKIIEATRPTQ